MNENNEPESNAEELNNLKVVHDPANDFFYFVFDLIKTAIIVFILAFSLRYFVVRPFIVDGESMMPNFVNNEYILAEKISYLIGQPERGDVVVFQYPGNPSVNYIKRIIGLPGETVKIANNKITIVSSSHPNGEVLTESYIPSDSKTYAMDQGSFEKTLGSNEYFVMGDNRQHSSDSREWGALPKTNIIGRAWLTIVPFNRFGIHSRISYSGFKVGLLTLEKALAKY